MSLSCRAFIVACRLNVAHARMLLAVPPGMGGPPTRVELSPPTVLIDDAAKRALWEACEAAVGAFEA